ncbi:MAG: two-component system sensor histidine kinase CreC [Bdellovibrionales bacterium]|nr:two-component system sensor histidine kinase CreC [Bdellovibrionales bacterium]
MTLRTSLLLFFASAVTAVIAFFVDWVTDDLKPGYRAAVEELMVDSAEILAARVALESEMKGRLSVEGLEAALANAEARELAVLNHQQRKTRVEARIYVTDAAGVVVYDSWKLARPGESYAEWRDVLLTLRGEYGARTSKDAPGDPENSMMYVAAPIILQGQLGGTLTLGKSARLANDIVRSARDRIALGAVFSVAIGLLFAALISAWFTRPLAQLERYAIAVRDGERAEPPPVKGEIGAVASAFEQMRESLEGRQYVERYLQTLTHELKSPITAIQASAELIGEIAKEPAAQKFTEHLLQESRRMRILVDRLLELSALERRGSLERREAVDLGAVVKASVDSLGNKARQQCVNLVIATLSPHLTVRGSRSLLEIAISNLIDNAIDFSPRDGQIEVAVTSQAKALEVRIRDQGVGIPDYARNRVFERFFSLPRPGSERKSTGLGLSIVREIATLHHGTVELFSPAEGGTEALLRLPTEQAALES